MKKWNRVAVEELVELATAVRKSECDARGILKPTSQRCLIPYTSLVMEKGYRAPWKALWKRVRNLERKSRVIGSKAAEVVGVADNTSSVCVFSTAIPSQRRWNKMCRATGIKGMMLDSRLLRVVYRKILGEIRRYGQYGLFEKGYTAKDVFDIGTNYFFEGAVKHAAGSSTTTLIKCVKNAIHDGIRKLFYFEVYRVNYCTLAKSDETGSSKTHPQVVSLEQVPEEEHDRHEDKPVSEITELVRSHVSDEEFSLFQAVAREVEETACKVSTAKARVFARMGIKRSTGFLCWNRMVDQLRVNASFRNAA